MLKRRLIPKLQLRAGRDGRRRVLVTTIRFARTIEIGDPVSQARIYQAQAADELVFLDLDASREGRTAFVDTVARAASELHMPLTVGGGVRGLEDFRLLLANGADKVALNTAALANPGLVREASGRFGAQCVVVSIDMERDGARWRVRGGPRGLDPADWAAEAERLGAGEILLTSVDRDGTREGLDLAGTRRVRERLSIPLIAAGGCGAASHFIEGFLEGGADAVAAGTYFCFKDENPMQTRSRIRNVGIPIRLHT
jgi:cyclase